MSAPSVSDVALSAARSALFAVLHSPRNAAHSPSFAASFASRDVTLASKASARDVLTSNSRVNASKSDSRSRSVAAMDAATSFSGPDTCRLNSAADPDALPEAFPVSPAAAP